MKAKNPLPKIFAILIAIDIIFFFVFNSYLSTENRIKRAVGIALPSDTKMTILEDSHGFHGDGEIRAVLEILKEEQGNFAKKLGQSDRWKAIPWSQDFQLLGFNDSINGMNPGYDLLKDWVPEKIDSGYWLITDRKRTIDLLDADWLSDNFELAVYDVQEGKLYVLIYDS